MLTINTSYEDNILGSDWGNLNKHLIAEFFPLVRRSNITTRDMKEPKVCAPLVDGAEIEYQLNWVSQFENANVDSKAPALTALAQSGQLEQGLSRVSNGLSTNDDLNPLGKLLRTAEGRAGITKLNSTQVFSSLPPIKIPMKILFKAYRDTQTEVMKPIEQLIKWGLPQQIGQDGLAMQLLRGEFGVESALPTVAPRLIGFRYRNRLYKPMVIESITEPITSPSADNGDYVIAELGITICSLSAWDKNDIHNIYSGKQRY